MQLTILIVLVVLAAGWWTWSTSRQRHKSRMAKALPRAEAPATAAHSGGSPSSVTDPAPSTSPPGALDSAPPKQPVVTEEVLAIAAEIEGLFHRSAYPRDLLRNESFGKGVALLSRPEHSDEVLLDYMIGANVIAACMALEALAQRPGDATQVVEPILADFTQVHLWTAYFALRVLSARSDAPVVGAVLAQVDETWAEPLPINILREFITLRKLRGETLTFGDELDRIDAERSAFIERVLNKLRDDIPASLRDEFTVWRQSRVDTNLLAALGRIVRTDSDAPRIATSERLDEMVAQLEATLRAAPPRSIALVGESGVGKTTIVHLLARRLASEGWVIFEAGGADLLAGQSFIGQLEGRVQTLVRAIRLRKVLWVVPNFQDLLWAGRHQNNPTGVLDMLLPALESGEIRVIGELIPAAHERLMQAKPQLRSLMITARVVPPREHETLALARRWVELRSGGEVPIISGTVLEEALQLANQYLNDRVSPGNVLHLLALTFQRLASARGAPPASIVLDDILLTLSQLSGLPMSILDERQGLNIDGLRSFFTNCVIGQPEAIDTLVERVTMIKAGVNDPSRPIGVFLFVGPTGTGKTEIAKTLARYLFGSAERMIRVDMSELQTAESLDRIVGEQRDGGEGTALVNEIRRQPFSVVLLDEFEKAHPNIWDLFLQVFDDGRLTDRRGKVADFRHAVIIMTSNLGATVPRGASIGFGTTQAGFAPVVVDRAVAETFRREFINRLDRVVVFRPLGRQEMRNILRKELDEVFQRRGLRNRNWAVEWDASAIDFLLDKGFTPDLGARPLKRAIDRYLLTPLAETIVRHEVPAGDQFLFVRSAGDRLDVVFVDPDAPQEPTSGGVATEEAESELDVRQLVLDPHGTVDEVDCLEDRYEDLAEVVESADWQQRKAGALSQLRAAGFWESPHRFAVLGLAEYMDRIEVGLDTARSLLRRLGSANGARQHYPRDLIQRLAEQLHLLDAACKTLAEGRPRDAYLVVRASRDSGTDRAEADVFAARLARMYTEWAANRRMRLEVLEENPGGGAGPYAALFAISGFGAFVILEPESGLHVMESPQDTKSFNRVKARVVVAPQADEPLADPRQACTVAMRAIDGAAESSARVIVRRYREEPSPLVRDAVRGWRTGRIDRVLAGNFDVVS